MKTTDFYLQLDEERAREWEPILGTRSLPIHWGEFEADLQGAGDMQGAGVQEVVLLDLECLDEPQRERLYAHLAEKSGCSIDSIRADIERDGLPIRTEGASLVIKNPQRWI